MLNPSVAATFAGGNNYHRGNTAAPLEMLSHPPSRLSPPPRADVYGVAASSSGLQLPVASSSASATYPTQLPQTAAPLTETKKQGQNLPKRGYRACTNCRLRKARCDLGDVNSPSEPPCSRCRREQRDCVFLPSKRRRRTSVADPALREEPLDLPQAEIYPAQVAARPSSATHSSGTQGPPGVSRALNQQGPPLASASSVNPSFPQLPKPAPNKDDSSSRMPFTQTGIWNETVQQTTSTEDQGKHQVFPCSTTYPTMHSVGSTQHHTDTTTPGSLGGSSTASTTALSPQYRSKKRKTEPSNRKIVNANLSNEMDALEILANAATDGDDEGEDGKRKQPHDPKKVTWNVGEEDKAPMRELGDFHLIKAGILDEHGLHAMVDNFFRHYHPALPIFQTARIPRCREQLLDLAHNDSFLLTCIIAVASRHPSDSRYKDVHDKTWAVIRDAMSDYSFTGLPGSVGFVEGVLLLAEHLPRERGTPPRGTSVDMLAGPGTESAGVHGTDNRRSWSLIGLAIRAAYLLGLDQISLEIDESSRTPDVERARSVWTWCYLYDRTIGLRTGLAFWSRGPALCFVGYSHISQTGEVAARLNFPLQLSPGAELDGTAHDDSASLMQSLVELTQVMTNAHDILYPSKLRTEVLVKQGEYFLFLDHFRRALDSYRTIWKPKQWSNRTLEELSWMTFHYVRLYISSFGYSAHIKRAQWRGDKEASIGRDGFRQAVQIFPRGSATSPDALYIYDSIAAANEILHISLRLAQMGSLRYLPSRYLINISYAAVFALKSSYSGAVEEKDMHRIRELVDHVCTGLVLSCPDKDHPAVRYGQMLRMLAKRLEELHDASAVPSRYPSPEPIETTSNSNASPQTSQDQSSVFPWPAPPNASTENNVPTPAFQLPPFPDMSFLTNSQVNPDYVEGSNTSNSERHEAMFDYGDTKFDFDLKGFWDDFTLGEGSGFPFR
ncbi:specific RNA polymerase II transcription factor [Cryptococcus neoformans]|nr:specific RNA polymerase II transcription factor [Cryptococcus neoformans var. grubii Bt85]OXG14102.1 specific RNA polymerase II transcription factor [Cryptococcus neoformans var. grubii Tu401-1]OXH26660.1 specific RNA polymerase II transcription factor [Cryptococcus neoformans var. grubii]OXM77521.1 specific RNA polymerase II transcription factor [Cryptococcus neoformans var. grubii Bt63]